MKELEPILGAMNVSAAVMYCTYILSGVLPDPRADVLVLKRAADIVWDGWKSVTNYVAPNLVEEESTVVLPKSEDRTFMKADPLATIEDAGLKQFALAELKSVRAQRLAQKARMRGVSTFDPHLPSDSRYDHEGNYVLPEEGEMTNYNFEEKHIDEDYEKSESSTHVASLSEMMSGCQFFSDSLTIPTDEPGTVPEDDESTSTPGSLPEQQENGIDSIDESTLNLARALMNLNVYRATSEVYDANLRIDDAYALIYDLKNEIKQLKEECMFLKAYSAVQDKFRFWTRQFPRRELPESVVFDMYGGYCFIARRPSVTVDQSPTKFRRARIRLSRDIIGKTVNGLTGETEDIATSTGLRDLA